ncbi:MAG: hypothetical protein AAF560_23210 [Acidobacteriota bacterium]
MSDGADRGPAEQRRVIRHLPQAYLRAGSRSAAHALTRALGRAVEELDRDAKKALRAHYLEDLNDLDDARRLAALLRLEPWPDEDLEAFRERLRTMARVALQGALNTRRLLKLVEVACGARLEVDAAGQPAVVEPRDVRTFPALLPGQRLLTDRFTTAAVLRHRASADPDGEGEVFSVAVEDLPEVEHEAVIEPAPGTGPLGWSVENPLHGLIEDTFTSPPSPPRSVDPRIRLLAGGSGLRLPVLVQHDLQRAVLINRIMRPGCVLEVDLVQRQLFELSPADAQSEPGNLRFRHLPAPPLLFGTGAILGDSALARGPQDPPAHALRWYLENELNPEAEAPLVGDRAAPDNLPWPGLLPLGTSQWSLLSVELGTTAPTLAIEGLRLRPRRIGEGPSRIEMRWRGRRPGTFALRFEPRHLSRVGDKPRTYRRSWFFEQVDRLQLAGTVRVAPEELAPAVESSRVGALENFDLVLRLPSGRSRLAEVPRVPLALRTQRAVGLESLSGATHIAAFDELEMQLHLGSRDRVLQERLRVRDELVEARAEGDSRDKAPSEHLAVSDQLSIRVERYVPRAVTHHLTDRVLASESLQALAIRRQQDLGEGQPVRDQLTIALDRFHHPLAESVRAGDALEAKRLIRNVSFHGEELVRARPQLAIAVARFLELTDGVTAGDEPEAAHVPRSRRRTRKERVAVRDQLTISVDSEAGGIERLVADFLLSRTVVRRRHLQERIAALELLEIEVERDSQTQPGGGRDNERNNDSQR